MSIYPPQATRRVIMASQHWRHSLDCNGTGNRTFMAELGAIAYKVIPILSWPGETHLNFLLASSKPIPFCSSAITLSSASTIFCTIGITCSASSFGHTTTPLRSPMM